MVKYMVNIRPNRGLDQMLQQSGKGGFLKKEKLKEKEQSLRGWGKDKPTFIQKFLGMIKKPRMTMIGPADLLKTIRKDNDMIQTMIITGKRS